MAPHPGRGACRVQPRLPRRRARAVELYTADAPSSLDRAERGERFTDLLASVMSRGCDAEPRPARRYGAPAGRRRAGENGERESLHTAPRHPGHAAGVARQPPAAPPQRLRRAAIVAGPFSVPQRSPSARVEVGPELLRSAAPSPDDAYLDTASRLRARRLHGHRRRRARLPDRSARHARLTRAAIFGGGLPSFAAIVSTHPKRRRTRRDAAPHRPSARRTRRLPQPRRRRRALNRASPGAASRSSGNGSIRWSTRAALPRAQTPGGDRPYNGAAPAGIVTGVARSGRRGRDRRQRRDGQGRHLLPDDGEEAPRAQEVALRTAPSSTWSTPAAPSCAPGRGLPGPDHFGGIFYNQGQLSTRRSRRSPW